jgi:chromosome segregation ATPase
MDYAELEKLEANIRKAITIIQKLHNENQRLKQLNDELLKQLKEQEKKIQQLLSTRNMPVDPSQPDHLAIEKEDRIKQKIQHMLEKLEAFQQVNTTKS